MWPGGWGVGQRGGQNFFQCFAVTFNWYNCLGSTYCGDPTEAMEQRLPSIKRVDLWGPVVHSGRIVGQYVRVRERPGVGMCWRGMTLVEHEHLRMPWTHGGVKFRPRCLGWDQLGAPQSTGDRVGRCPPQCWGRHGLGTRHSSRGWDGVGQDGLGARHMDGMG